jgi:hypothetical protein
MKRNQTTHLLTRIVAITLCAGLLMTGCGGGRTGAAIKATPQSITFGAAPTLTLLGTATVSASASSGLNISYSSLTSTVCRVDNSSGLVTNLALGTCTIAADQAGNETYAPAPQATQNIVVSFDPNQIITFGAAPTLTLYGTATVSATVNSGLAPSFSSLTASVCTVNSVTGIVTDLTAGTCTIAADQTGNSSYNAAPQATQTLNVAAWAGGLTVPSAPAGVSATIGNTATEVIVSFTGSASSGGTPITAYTVTSTINPAITATASASPITITCPSTCSGHAFTVLATNATGNSASSTAADVITDYNVVTTFFEPDTQPNDSIFVGTFTLNSTTATVTNLKGKLSESMTGGYTGYPNDTMIWLPLNYQLSSATLGTGGLVVTSFLLNTTNTLSTIGGGDGWAPGSGGGGLYYGYPSIAFHPSYTGIGNAYIRIFVNPSAPTAALTPAQLDYVAYADCAPGGMMGDVCMTGTSIAGYGTIGTMSGFPLSQIITRK